MIFAISTGDAARWITCGNLTSDALLSGGAPSAFSKGVSTPLGAIAFTRIFSFSLAATLVKPMTACLLAL